MVKSTKDAAYTTLVPKFKSYRAITVLLLVTCIVHPIHWVLFGSLCIRKMPFWAWIGLGYWLRKRWERPVRR